MYRLVLCLPSVGQPQGLPVLHKTPKNQYRRLELERRTGEVSLENPLTLNCQLKKVSIGDQGDFL
jgi:hypothetical protein